MAELADAQDLGSCPARGGGSTPPGRTTTQPGATTCTGTNLQHPPTCNEDPPSGTEAHGNDTKREVIRQGSGKDSGACPADLARVVNAWPDLPEPIRAAVVALVGTIVKRGDTTM